MKCKNYLGIYIVALVVGLGLVFVVRFLPLGGGQLLEKLCLVIASFFFFLVIFIHRSDNIEMRYNFEIFERVFYGTSLMVYH